MTDTDYYHHDLSRPCQNFLPQIPHDSLFIAEVITTFLPAVLIYPPYQADVHSPLTFCDQVCDKKPLKKERACLGSQFEGIQSFMAGTSQWQEHEAGSQEASTVGKQREMHAGAQLTFSL